MHRAVKKTPSKSGPSPRSEGAVQIELERLQRKGCGKQMSFKSGVKGCLVIDGESEDRDVLCAG